MAGVVEILGTLLGAGKSPQLAAHRLGIEVVEDARMRMDMFVSPESSLILVRPGTAVEIAARTWVGLIWMMSDRLGFKLSNNDRAAALLYLLEQSPPKKSVSGFLEKTGS